MIRPILAPLLLLVGACASGEDRPAAAPRPIAITYETQPCFGTCPVYAVTVTSLGTPGVFEGRRFTAVTGRRDFAVGFAQFDAFLGALAPAFGADAKDYEAGGSKCRQFATDHPGVAVTWREGNDAPRTFRFNYGCRDAQNAALAAALRRAPTLLPIADLIGRR